MHDIWTVAKQTFSRVRNNAQIYELHKKVHETKKKGMTVSAYYSELKSQWQFDYYQDFQADWTTDFVKFKKLVD